MKTTVHIETAAELLDVLDSTIKERAIINADNPHVITLPAGCRVSVSPSSQNGAPGGYVTVVDKKGVNMEEQFNVDDLTADGFLAALALRDKAADLIHVELLKEDAADNEKEEEEEEREEEEGTLETECFAPCGQQIAAFKGGLSKKEEKEANKDVFDHVIGCRKCRKGLSKWEENESL